MSLFDFFRKKRTAQRRPARSRARLRIEELERRETPANDILTVAGAAGQQVSVSFELLPFKSVFWNEVGVIPVDDAQGRIGDQLPGDNGYVAAALENAQTVFRAGDLKGETTDLSFTAGQNLIFYLVQNNTLENLLETNPNNLPRVGNQVFFSIDIANRDRFDHLKTQLFGDRSMKLFWEDTFGGGDRDFNDNVMKLSFAAQGTSQAIGLAGQSIPTRFRYLSSSSIYRSEVGFFLVDDAAGRIGTLSPGSEGYAEAAIERAQRLYRTGVARPGAVRNVQLPGAGFFGLYLIAGGTAGSFLRRNPDNRLDKPGPLAFFSFDAANPDGVNHVRWISANVFAFEDERKGGDKDFNDFVGTIVMRKPPNTAPIVRTAIPNKTVLDNAASEEIDLAGTFFDQDLNNSLVRIATNKGTFDMELFDRDAPRTVANFLNYVTDGDFTNAIFHRRANSPDVLQGGGFQFSNNGTTQLLTFDKDDADALKLEDPPVANEPDFVKRSNVRGTIAMAKSSANDATSQFFFNVGDNATALNNPSNSGGFTVFGRVVEGQMSIVDQLAAIPPSPRGGVFNEIPLANYNGSSFPSDLQRDNLIVINSITVLRRPEFLRYAVVSNSNPAVANLTLIHNHATLDYISAGTTTIVLSATDSVGHVRTTQFTVTVNDDDTTPPVVTLSGSQGSETDAQNQNFTWSASDAGSGLATTAVTVTKDGGATPIFTSSNAAGNFDFNSFGPGVYVMTVTATDADNDGPGDSLTTTQTRSVTVTDDDDVAPTVDLTGSVGTETDAQTQQFTWAASDAGSGLETTTVTVTQDNISIFSSSAASGTFNFDAFGLGVFVITVTALDADDDWAGDGRSTTMTRSVTVNDDDADPPIINLGGSIGTETEADDQKFTWDVLDVNSGPPSVTVTVTQVGVGQIFSSTAVSGVFDFNSFGQGSFTITVAATDTDNDFTGDSLSNSANRSVTVTA